MNAPLPAPSKTTASGNTQHREATNAEARPAMPDFTFKIRILTVLPKRFFVIVHRPDEISATEISLGRQRSQRSLRNAYSCLFGAEGNCEKQR